MTAKAATKQATKWLDNPQEHDHPAALSYLSLLYKPKAAKALVKKLKAAKVVSYKTKDIFRSGRRAMNPLAAAVG